MRTLAIAAAVAIVCSLVVSTAVYLLRPYQLAYRSIDRNRAVIVAAGLSGQDEALSDRAVVELFVDFDAQLLDLESGTYADSDAVTAANYDYRDALDSPEQTQEIPREIDVAGIGRRPLLMPVYVLRRGTSIECMVLPIYGRGMWSTIYGFLSVGPDYSTIVGVRFYEHGESPGIGDRIQRAEWVEQWRGKRIYADDGGFALNIGARPNPGADSADVLFQVDAITGATVTVTAVNNIVRYWFGNDGYGPFLARLRSEVP